MKAKQKYRKNKKIHITLFLVSAFIIIILQFHPGAKVMSVDSETSSTVYIEVPTFCQYPLLPTGCEVTAAAMLLQYYGIDVTPEVFATEWLSYDESYYYENERLIRPDPNEVFVGNPFTSNSYGCYAPVIVDAINGNTTLLSAELITEKDLKTLCNDYLNQNHPLLIWATMDMKPSKEGNSWFFPSGEPFTWIAGEHCLVLVGYDEDHYYLNDPQTGSTVFYKKELVEKRFQELGAQAISVSKNNPDEKRCGSQ